MATWETQEHGVPAFEKIVLVGKTNSDGELTAFDSETEIIDALYEVPATDANLNLANELLDDTDLTSQDARSNITGLREWSVDTTLNYKPDNDAYEIIRDSYIDREPIWVVYIPNIPTGDDVEEDDEGYIGRVIAENLDHSGGVGDLETVDCTLQSTSTIHWEAISEIPEDITT